MTNPEPPMKQPIEIELEPGDYWWCHCGKSAKQPFCDGSHQGTGFSPVKFTVTEKKKVWLCGCKQTGDRPYCDGTHNSLD